MHFQLPSYLSRSGASTCSTQSSTPTAKLENLFGRILPATPEKSKEAREALQQVLGKSQWFQSVRFLTRSDIKTLATDTQFCPKIWGFRYLLLIIRTGECFFKRALFITSQEVQFA